MRHGEILRLRKSQVDVSRGAIHLIDTKNGDQRCVPLTGLAHELLKQRVSSVGDSDGLLFPGTAKQRPFRIWKPWYAAVTAAGIKDLRFHDLRHTAASHLAMNGATQIELAAVLGHKTLQMVKRYAHLSDSHTHAVVAAMNKKVFGDDTDAAN